MNQKYCQSCGMPMDSQDVYGTNQDGSKNMDYCKYCFDKGAFTSNCSVDEMIEFCVPHVSGTETGMSEEEARGMMRSYFPTLKRWKSTK